MNEAQMKAELARLTAENNALKAKLKLDISDKGCVTLHGVRRFGVSFYQEEWGVILGQAEAITKFIEANQSNPKLKRKGVERPADVEAAAQAEIARKAAERAAKATPPAATTAPTLSPSTVLRKAS